MTAPHWLTPERLSRYPRLFFAVYAVVMVAWVAMADGMIDRSGTPLGGDFISFYTGGRLAAEGRAAAAYLPDQHGELERSITGQSDQTFFAYPPPFLMVARAFATLPYLPAFLAWQLFSLAVFAQLVRRIWGGHGTAWFVLGFPATFVNFIHGQTGFLSGALVAWFTMSIRDRPWQAGIAVGLSTFKPHFVLAMGLVILITRQWKALLAAIGSGAVVALLSWLFLGASAWRTYLDIMPAVGKLMFEQGGPGWHKMVSTFALLRQLGVPLNAAMAAQIAVAVLAATLLVILWRQLPAAPATTTATTSDSASTTLQGSLARAAVALATIVMTPYALDYDLVIIGVAMVYLAKALRLFVVETSEGAIGDRAMRGMEFALIALWLMPFATRPLAQAGCPIAAPVMLVVMFKIFQWNRTVSVSKPETTR